MISIQKLLKNITSRHAIIFLAITGFLLYSNTLGNQMFWDDDDFILKNTYIRDWSNFPKFFGQSVTSGSGILSNYWRPVLLTVFSLQWHLWGDNVLGYHLVNTSIHLIDSILLFFLISHIFKRKHIALLTALFFLIHPLQTEAVTYVNSLGDSLSVFFILTGLLLYWRFKTSNDSEKITVAKKLKLKAKPIFLLLSVLTYPLALMSKETAITMPGLILIIDLVISQNGRFKTTLIKIAKSTWPFFATTFTYIALRATTLNFQNTFNLYGQENLYTSSFFVRLFTFFKVLTTYFKLMFFPTNLHMERSLPLATNITSPTVIAGIFIFLALAFTAIYFFKKTPLVSFGIAWFAITIFPTSNLAVPVSGILYEHWLYLPLAGIFLVVSHFIFKLLENPKLKTLTTLSLIIFISFLSIQTIKRNWQWRNPIVLYSQTLQYSPNSYRVTNNLGMEYAQIGDLENAKIYYSKAIDLDDQNPVAFHNLGNLHQITNQPDLAVESFQTAINLDPNFLFSYRSLANLHFSTQNYSQAEKILTGYLEHNQPSLDIYLALTQIALIQENIPEAITHLEQAVSLDPTNQQLRSQLLLLRNQL